MTNEVIDLARRAVACPGWRWMPGMLGALGRARLRVSSTLPGELVGLRMGGRVVWSDDRVFPDLTDPATLGCLLALVREAWGCPVWVSLDVEPDAFDALDDSEYVLCEPLRWTVWRAPDGDYVQPCGSGPTEAAALVAALEAAPR